MRQVVLRLLLCLVIVAPGTVAAGCGDAAPETTSSTAMAPISTSTVAATTTESTQPEMTHTGTNVPAFAELAERLASVPVFVLQELPTGLEVAEEWWAVVESTSPSDAGASDTNPYVIGEDTPEPEGQLVLDYADGWVMVMANVMGDLGDVVGEPVGSVAGLPAHLYEMNGGYLVQWSYEGRWYAVFGRDVPVETVTSVALAMTLF